MNGLGVLACETHSATVRLVVQKVRAKGQRVGESTPLSAAFKESVRFFAAPSGDQFAVTHIRAAGGLVGPFPLDCIKARPVLLVLAR